jgi:hypothetical protein
VLQINDLGYIGKVGELVLPRISCIFFFGEIGFGSVASVHLPQDDKW